MEIRRGSVWWWNCYDHSRPHIQKGMRPVVIVSNNLNNQASSVVTVIPFTTGVRRPYPQQVPVIFNDDISIALTDQITAIPVGELHGYICDLRQFQMDQIDNALAIQLGFLDVEDRSFAPFPTKRKVNEHGSCEG